MYTGPYQRDLCAARQAQGGPDSPQAARKALVAISSCIRDVRKRSDATDALFGPLQAMVGIEIYQFDKYLKLNSVN